MNTPHTSRVRRISLSLLAALLLCGCSPLVERLGIASQTEHATIEEASGTLEADELIVSAEIGGRITAIPVEEGQSVESGQIVLTLDDASLSAQIDRAQAALHTAEAERNRLLAGARPGQIASAEAALALARAKERSASTALEDAQTLRDQPLALDARIHAAQAQLKLAQAGVEPARAALAEAQVSYASAQGGGSDAEKTVAQIMALHVQVAEANVRLAEQGVSGAEATLKALRRLRQTPAGLDAAVHRAESGLRLAQADVEVKMAALAVVLAQPRAEEVALARRKVELAQCGVERLEAQRSKLTLLAPGAGVVSTLAVQAGEIAAPGAALLALADLTRIRLIIYVPEPRLGLVYLGQPVKVQVDAFPDRVFTGQVVHIADRAEYTPRNVQTQDERAQTVFAVKIALDNPDLSLRPGMSATAELQP